MSGSSRSGFTWNEIAEILRVSQEPNAVSLLREIKSQREGSPGWHKRCAAHFQSAAVPPAWGFSLT
jgi:hypothetical protein